jgi:hypothetical protein
MTAIAPTSKRLVVRGALIGATLLAAAVWLGNAWSPSSYAIILRSLGVHDTGLVLGTPREVRGDEWAILTPLVQATVNNGLGRYNETSFYREDLRTVDSVPVADWGLAFKPDQWLYPFVDAAYAFSFQHLVYIVAFLAGYALLFARLGVGAAAASLLSFALFFTAFAQFWWTTFAPNLAYFPWLLLGLGVRQPALRALAFVWVAVAWMLGYFYPPIFIALAVAIAAVYGSRWLPERGIRGAAFDATLALAACAIAAFYLRDFLAATWNTVYPGLRSLRGGTIPWAQQLQTLWPTAFLSGFESRLPNRNVCEAAVVGSYYFLLAACFVDARALRRVPLPATSRRLAVAAAIGLALLASWQMLPIPASLGRWLLFDRVLPQRMMFATGFLLLLIAALAVEAGALRFTVARLAAFCAAVIAGWAATKWTASPFPGIEIADAAVFPVAIGVLVAGRRFPKRGPAIVAGASALLGLLAFGAFNPIQSAHPIFHRESTPVTRALEAIQQRTPGGVLVVDQFGTVLNAWGQGATLNGLGFRSAAHVLLAPELALWQRLLPEMDPAERDRIFNRSAQIVVRDLDAPRLLAINIAAVPPRAFGAPPERWFSVRPPDEIREWPAPGGHIAARTVSGRRVALSGWAPWRGLAPGQSLVLYSSLPLSIVSARRFERPDVVAVLRDERLRFSGFLVELDVPEGAGNPDRLAVCLVARDAIAATAALVTPEPGAPACGAAPPR